MYGQAQIVGSGNNLVVQHGTDAGLYVEFYIESIHDEEASAEQGRPIYVDREFIKIIPVGDKNTVICRPVRFKEEGGVPPDTMRWAAKYEQFKRQGFVTQEGTPLEQWPILTKSQVMMMKSSNVHTVEQLAAVADGNLGNLGMGARELQEKAKIYLQQAKDGSGLEKLHKENEVLRDQIEALRNEIKALAAEKPKRAKKDEE